MASSKNLFLLLGVLFVLALFISSQVAASHDDLTSESAVVTADGHGHGYGYPGKGHGGGGGGKGGYRGGGGGGGGGKGKGGCRYGCCRGYRYSHGCNRCCSTANEAHDLTFADDIPN